MTKKHKLTFPALISLIACVFLFAVSYVLFAYSLGWAIHNFDRSEFWKSSNRYFDIVKIMTFIQWPILFVGFVLSVLLFFVRARKPIFIALLCVLGLCILSTTAHLVVAIILLYTPRGYIGFHGLLIIFAIAVATAVTALSAIAFSRYLKSKGGNRYQRNLSAPV